MCIYIYIYIYIYVICLVKVVADAVVVADAAFLTVLRKFSACFVVKLTAAQHPSSYS